MTNKLYVGLTKTIEPPKGGCLFISDEVPNVPRSRIFDPMEHCFDPLKDLDYRKAREIAEILYTIAPQGENTLTVRNGKRALLKLLLENPARLDEIEMPVSSGRNKADDAAIEAVSAIQDVLVSPVLRRVLCNPTNFSFNPRSTIFARISRAELGDFDALVLGLFLMAHFKGQLVIPDLGFYGREAHVKYIREGRLIAGVNTLSELPAKLRQSVLLIKDKVASRTTYEDAQTLALYEGHNPDPLREDNEYNKFIQRSIA